MRTAEKRKLLPERLRDQDLTTEKHDAIVQWIDRRIPGLIWDVCANQIERDSSRRLGPPTEIGLRVRTKTWEYAVTKGGPGRGTETSVIGFIDLRVDWETSPWREHWERQSPISFEAKTYIKSCGELIRQIRLYETYLPSDRFVVVSPDLRFAELLRSQRIGFIPYLEDAEVVA
jgi:hypothetical protein